MYFDTIAELEDRYNALHSEYPDAHFMIFDYLKEHLWGKRRKWTKCYTDKVLHFGNTVSSRGEEAHYQIKKELQFSTGKSEERCKKVKLTEALQVIFTRL